MKRRTFIKRGIQSASLLYFFPFCNIYANTTDKEICPDNFPVFIDTLIPEDETPSASQLHMHTKLIGHAKTIKNYPALIRLGCDWLNLHANTTYALTFETLNEQQRIATVLLAEQSALGSIPRLFFDRIRTDLFQFYYADPQSWKGLGINSPPQPAGYPDYADNFDLTLYD